MNQTHRYRELTCCCQGGGGRVMEEESVVRRGETGRIRAHTAAGLLGSDSRAVVQILSAPLA